MHEGQDAFYGFTPFEVREPARHSVPFVFNSPHSGRVYPQAFLAQSRLDPVAIRKSEDFYVEELFQPVTALGAPLLMAHFPRAFLDVNREPYELDPRMFEGRLPAYANVASMRVAGGLGTIPRLVAENMDIYRGKLPVAEAIERIETIYRPYHACLRKLMARTHAAFGTAILVDCHSMPANVRLTGSATRPDFIVGDRYGTSAAQEISRAAAEILSGLGYHVIRNKPYAGGFITEHYGRPGRGLHAIQIEINRGLYVDEQTLARTGGFEALRADLARFAAALIATVGDRLDGQALAAE